MPEPSLFLDFGLVDRYLIGHPDALIHCLDSFEQAELSARNYRFKQRSAQYIYARLVLKARLSRGLHVSAHSLSVRSTPSGKPQLYMSGRFINDVSLSLSHDKEKLFVAAGLGCRCGVDIQSIHGVDWLLIMRAMGWSNDATRWLAVDRCDPYAPPLTFGACSALLWAAFEAWMKLTECTYTANDFAWSSINFIAHDPAACASIYEMQLATHCPHNNARVLLRLTSNEALAVATLSF
jgi:phosphopantetheinyl transferase (holo-ACP synthase)